jgi:hypothetical protein
MYVDMNKQLKPSYVCLPLNNKGCTALDFHELLLHLEEVGEGEGQDYYD